MVGIYTIDVSMMSAESKKKSNSWTWYALIIKVGFSQQKLKCKLHVFCLAPKVSVFLLCFAKDISDSIFRTISFYHSLVNLFVEIMFTACFC